MANDGPLPLSPGQRFWRLLKPDRKEIWNVYTYSVVSVLVNLSLPLGIQAIINLIQGGKVTTSWIVLIGLVVLGVLITGLLQISQLRITENLQKKIFTRAAFEFSYRIPRVKMEALYKHYVPELMNRFFDIVTVQKGLAKMLIDFSSATLNVFFGLILLSLYHPFFILFSLILMVLVFGVFRLTINRGLRTSIKESKHKYQVVHWLEELARTHTTFKLAGVTDLPLHRTDGHVGDYLRERENHFRVLIQQYGLMVIFKALVTSGLLVLGGILVMDQQMNIGQFVAAEIIILLILASVEKLVQTMETVYDVLTALEKVGQVTDLPLETRSDEAIVLPDAPEGLTVKLDKVSFTYPDQNRPVLDDLSLEVKPGERLLLLGGNGSGKSTLLNMLAGLYEPEHGGISYDGLPRGNLDLTALRSQIGDCLIQEHLFQGTLLENIAMGRRDATLENVQWAVEHLNLSEFVRSLPQGYNTVLDPQGKKLPRSTVQKLLLARSIADKPRLLLLDDPFEQIAAADRERIMRFLTDPKQRWTLVVSAPDPLLPGMCSRSLHLVDGRIYESQDRLNPDHPLNAEDTGHA